jgi:LytR cell envelope-related transcriptional attenuator
MVGFAGIGACALLLGACGGGDDAEDATTTTTVAPTVTIAPTETTTPQTTLPTVETTVPPLVLVTEGASIVVANASGINGAAGRMTDAIAIAGFKTGAAANSSEGQLGTSKVYYDPANASAKAVADSLREALGGGDIQVVELTVPAPLGEPDALGDASIILAMGNDIADRDLDELQGRVAPTTDPETTADSSGESSGEESSSGG